MSLQTTAVVLRAPERLGIEAVELAPPGEDDVVIDIEWSGISTGTERLLYEGRMPEFPGMGYPLVPGYESVGRIHSAGVAAGNRVGERVFVPGARCFRGVRGLFGGAAARLIVPASRAIRIGEDLGAQAVLLALAATARHALAAHEQPPDLIVGHGVLGRLLARLAVIEGGRPVVWERNAARACGAGAGYSVIDPGTDARRDYHGICDVSGDAGLLDRLIGCLARGGQIVLAGFYERPLAFAFAPAFMREARIRVAAEWEPRDLQAVTSLIASGRLSLDGLITHRFAAAQACDAYRTAFTDPSCLKMILDWRACA